MLWVEPDKVQCNHHHNHGIVVIMCGIQHKVSHRYIIHTVHDTDSSYSEQKADKTRGAHYIMSLFYYYYTYEIPIFKLYAINNLDHH